MSACIRLRRTGTKKKPSYRIVVADSRFPKEGRFIEILGHYNPRSNPVTLVVKEERAKYWLGVGALPSRTVNKLLAIKGLMEPPPHRMSAPPKVEKAATEEAPPKAEAKAEEKPAVKVEAPPQETEPSANPEAEQA